MYATAYCRTTARAFSVFRVFRPGAAWRGAVGGNGRGAAAGLELDDRHRPCTGRDVGEPRERMAKLEGSLEGFLAGQRGRSAA